MLEELQKQGWTVEREGNGIVSIFACFDDGFWSYINIWPAEVFAQDFKNDPAFVEKADVGDMAFVVTSMTTHRMTNPYDSYYIKGKTNSFDDALSLANDVCQYQVERFDSFCED